jgi:hypothetical protein
MTAKQKILTGSAVLVLTGLPVYQQTRINALSDRMTALTEASATKEKRAPIPLMGAVSNNAQPPSRIAGSAGDKTKAGEPGAAGGGETVARVQVPRPGEATFSKRGSGVVLDSFRATTPATAGAEDGALALAGGLEASSQRESPTTAGHVQWDHAQATGAPDTKEPGDRPTAWAPRSPKSGEQWLQLGYNKPVEVKEINVHETYNSGAISKVTAFLPDGSEKTLWTGNAAPGAANEIQETSIPVPAGTTSNQIKVYVDTNRVASWPEIDAVELVGRNGSRQWASSSSASSSYSELYSGQAGLESTTRNLGGGDVEYEGRLGSGSSSRGGGTGAVLDLGNRRK